jgi:hypothetical protein
MIFFYGFILMWLVIFCIANVIEIIVLRQCKKDSDRYEK